MNRSAPRRKTVAGRWRLPPVVAVIVTVIVAVVAVAAIPVTPIAVAAVPVVPIAVVTIAVVPVVAVVTVVAPVVVAAAVIRPRAGRTALSDQAGRVQRQDGGQGEEAERAKHGSNSRTPRRGG